MKDIYRVVPAAAVGAVLERTVNIVAMRMVVRVNPYSIIGHIANQQGVLIHLTFLSIYYQRISRSDFPLIATSGVNSAIFIHS